MGILAVVAMLMLYFGFNFLKGQDFFSTTRQYEVVYDNIDGLTPSNPVLLNGLTVGQVKSIDILQNQSNRLLVTFELNNKIVIGTGSRAILADGALLGGKIIRLVINQKGAPLANGGRLVAEKESGLSALIREKTLPVLTNVDTLVVQLNRVVASFDQTAIILNKTLSGANAVTGSLNATLLENRAGLNQTLANVNRLSASLIETEKQLKPILTKTSTFTDSLSTLPLKQTLRSVNQSIQGLQKILADINKGRGSLGKLTTDDSLYVNVSRSTASLEKLLTDLRQNPKKYVHFSLFGRKEDKQPTTPLPASAPVIYSPRSMTTDTGVRADTTK